MHITPLFIMLIICSLILTGCSSSHPQRDIPTARAEIRQGITRSYSRTELEGDILVSNERAKKIANAIASLEEIDKASVVVSGSTALVGIVVNGKPDDAEILKCKGRVERETKAADTQIDHVAITTALDLVKRVTKMADSATSNKRPKKFNNELRSVMKKLSV